MKVAADTPVFHSQTQSCMAQSWGGGGCCTASSKGMQHTVPSLDIGCSCKCSYLYHGRFLNLIFPPLLPSAPPTTATPENSKYLASNFPSNRLAVEITRKSHSEFPIPMHGACGLWVGVVGNRYFLGLT